MRAQPISTKVNKPENAVKLIQLATASASTAARSRRPSQASKYSCVQLGRRLGDQVVDQNNIIQDRHLGDRNGARHREVVQSDEGLRIYSAAGRQRPPRRAWLRIFVVRCGLPGDPPVE